jgi:hypothetical protein
LPTWFAAKPSTVFDVFFANYIFALAFYDTYTFSAAGLTAFEANPPTA